eukprot:tig00000788_g4081.t1
MAGIQHLQVEPNGDPRFDITPDGNVSRTVTGYHAMRTALAAARELLDEDSDFHAYCVQLVLAIIRFRTLTVLPGALGFEKGSLFAWISPKDVAPPLSLFQTYTERLTEVAGATCFDTRAKGTVPERVIAMQNSRRARCMAGEPPLVNLILDLRRPTEFSSLLFSDWLMGLGTYHAAPTVVVDSPSAPAKGSAFYDRSYPITRRGRCCDYDVIELLASRTVPREGRGPLPGGVRDSSEYSWLVNALHGEFSAANRWGEMHRSIFTWVCYCISQSGVRAVALLEKPRDRVRLMLGEVRRRFTAKRSHRPVWDEFDDDLQTSDRMAREVAEREAAAGRRGRGKGKVDETTSAAKPARTRGTSRRPAPPSRQMPRPRAKGKRKRPRHALS